MVSAFPRDAQSIVAALCSQGSFMTLANGQAAGLKVCHWGSSISGERMENHEILGNTKEKEPCLFCSFSWNFAIFPGYDYWNQTV
jgi:uncharacterized protein YodC (DUF2158 family)